MNASPTFDLPQRAWRTLASIRLTIVQDEDRSQYRQLIEEELRGAGLKQGPVAQKIVNAVKGK